ncbi:unnamed protein product [Owenia fusiformis]|uniref:Integrator complex subunit 1 n=1 Tax=Owenia fusiformis TaxID=6347 RepID=A0A8J1U5X3_OWEFU|nr:unnamed protein product [Owenia fusiformis]
MASKLKRKGHMHPGEMIALGSKPKQDEKSLAKKPGLLPSDRKREAPPGSSLASKKAKMSVQQFTPLGRPMDSDRRASPSVIPQWEETAAEVDASEFLESITEAEKQDNEEQLERLLCGAVKYLRRQRVKPEPAMHVALMHIAKSKQHLYTNSDMVTEALCSLLKRDVALNFKTKGNPLVSVLVCNILVAAFQDEENWPDHFIKVFLEDSIGERVWVDREDCKGFVENIQTAFNTRMPPKSTLLSFGDIKDQSGSPSRVGIEDDDDKSQDSGDVSHKHESLLPELESIITFPRYSYQQSGVENQVLDCVKEQLMRRQATDNISKNVLRLLLATCGYSEVRVMCAQRLEMWLHNPKLSKAAQDLLMGVCMNCEHHTSEDGEVISHLIKIRLKNKPLVNHFMLCMREVVSLNSENLKTVMTHTIYNELSNSRNPNNMTILGVAFQHAPDKSARLLAEIFQDLLANKDDYLRALRALLREIGRQLRHDITFSEFALGLMQERLEARFMDMEQQFKERYVQSISDLITLSALLCVGPQVREASAAYTRGDYKDIETVRKFQRQISVIQRDAVWWLHTVVPKITELKTEAFVHCLHKVLFVEQAEQYYNKDNWPPEGERGPLLRLVSEVAVLEDTLMRILVMGLSKDLPLNASDALELADQIVRRAAALHADGYEVLHVDRLELIDALLNLCAYHHPDNIVLPKGYQPPSLAISNLYWKAWGLLLIIVTFNPTTFGSVVWEKYPTLRYMMEMVITSNYKFPPETVARDDKTVDEIKARDKQARELEKQRILDFESHLAAATSKVAITEQNSLLIPQLTSMDPNGIARKPGSKVLEQLKSLNSTLKLGQMLCRSRKPDFLLDIIQRQGSSQSMPWLADLVEGSEGSLDILPVACVCEFMLQHVTLHTNSTEEDSDAKESPTTSQKQEKQEQLLSRLQTLLQDDTNETGVSEVLSFFMKRLVSHQASQRQLAVKGLSLVLGRQDDITDVQSASLTPSHTWLLEQLPSLPLFHTVKQTTCDFLRQACLVSSDIESISAYLLFLNHHSEKDDIRQLDTLVMDIGQLIVERSTVMNQVLPVEYEFNERAQLVQCAVINMFFSYLNKARQTKKDTYTWCNTQDQVLLQWPGGESANMSILVVHAIIILLTYGRPLGDSHFDELLKIWFPEGGSPPTAYLVDTSEEALLLPDWLKLRMIRSTVGSLVDAALQDLEPGKLLLFVQSFGMPVASMSKLLSCLDQATELGPSAMEQVDTDRSGYMAQLIEVQQMRGAMGGDKFRAVLLGGKEPTPDPGLGINLPKMSTERPVVETHRTDFDNLPSDQKKLQHYILQMFNVDVPKDVCSVHSKYRTLQLAILKEPLLWEHVVLALGTLLHSGYQDSLLAAMYNMQTVSCQLIRLLNAKQSSKGREDNTLAPILQILQQKGPTSSLKSLVEQCQKQDKARTNKHSQSSGSNTQANINKVLTEGKRLFGASLEEFVHKHFNSDTSGSGKLLDWFSTFEPEIISNQPELKEKLLFSAIEAKSGDAKSGEAMSCRPYLLALLTHKTNWTTLNRCIDTLLCEEQIANRDHESVLDFLWACIHIPKIWQGRDKNVSKNAVVEKVLKVSPQQARVITRYIVSELIQIDEKSTQHLLARRLLLLLHCLQGSQECTKAVVHYLASSRDKPEKEGKVCESLLLSLYTEKPNIINMLDDCNFLFNHSMLAASTSSQMDRASHHLLTSLADTGKGKKYQNKMYDANIALRKIAAHHPTLLLRQLPLMASLLKGRTYYTFGEFQARNNLLLFTHVLGIMDALQPYIFKNHSTALAEVLDRYFELMRVHATKDHQVAPLVNKYMRFLNSFISADPLEASQILQSHLSTLNLISQTYPDFALVRSIIASVGLPRQQTEASENGVEDDCPIEQPRPSSPWRLAQLAPFLKNISAGSSLATVTSVLIDLDETSKRKLDVLEHFLDDLKRLLTVTDEKCRKLSFTLVMRHIRQNPGSGKDFVPTILQCLDSSNYEVVSSALTNIAEFTLLCREMADVLLEKVFIIGIRLNIDTHTYITEAMQLLNMDNSLHTTV